MNDFIEFLSLLVLIGCVLMPVSAVIACVRDDPRWWWMFCLGVAVLMIGILANNDTVMKASDPQAVSFQASLLSLILPATYCAAGILSVVIYAIVNFFSQRK